MRQRNVAGEAGKGRKKCKGETERRGQMGGWPAEITAWVIGRVTAAIDPLIGCLTVSTRLPNPLKNGGVSYCVCVCVSPWECVCVCVKTSAICAICSPCLRHQSWYLSTFLRRLIRAPYSCTDKHTHHPFPSHWDKTCRSVCVCVLSVTFSDVCTLWGESVTKCYTGPQPFPSRPLTLIGQQDEEHTSLPAAHSTPLLPLNAKTQYVCACVCHYQFHLWGEISYGWNSSCCRVEQCTSLCCVLLFLYFLICGLNDCKSQKMWDWKWEFCVFTSTYYDKKKCQIKI